VRALMARRREKENDVPNYSEDQELRRELRTLHLHVGA
jgi:hypothetical protein